MKTRSKRALGAWAWGNDSALGGNMTADSLRPIFDTVRVNGLDLVRMWEKGIK